MDQEREKYPATAPQQTLNVLVQGTLMVTAIFNLSLHMVDILVPVFATSVSNLLAA